MASDPTSSVEQLDRLFASDGITQPVRQRSPEIRALRAHARKLAALWETQGRARRLEVFRALSPYTKLAYFAATPRTARQVLRKRDWLTYLFRVSRRAARARPGSVIASHLLFIAAGIGRFTEVDRPERLDADAARDAIMVLELAMAYADCPIEAFVNAAAAYQRVGNWERVLSVSLEAERRMDARGQGKRARLGVDGFDVGGAVRANVLLAAKHLNRVEILRRFSPPAARAPDPAITLERLFGLITAARYDDAMALGRDHRDAGGALTPEILANLVAVNSYRGDATHDLEFFEYALERLTDTPPERDLLAQPDLVGNVCWVLNEQQRCAESLALITAHEALAPALPAVLWDRRMYAARYSGDADEARKQAEHLLARHHREPEFLRGQPWAFYNAAAALAAVGRREAALDALATARELGCDLDRGSPEDFGELARDPELLQALGIGLVV